MRSRAKRLAVSTMMVRTPLPSIALSMAAKLGRISMGSAPLTAAWLDFFASVIGSLAWPGLVLVVLWYNRQRLASLPDWIKELKLPGGTKIKFKRALDEARLLAAETATPASAPSLEGVAPPVAQ